MMSPHARGCSGRLRRARRRRLRCPRTRGDAPVAELERKVLDEMSPHARGCSGGAVAARAQSGDVPARAGMLRRLRSRSASRRRCPRTRGDAPPLGCGAAHASAMSPHARGCSGDPAAHRAAPQGCPRTRGDAPANRLGRSRALEMSPHARGCSAPFSGGAPAPADVPARAGMLRPAPRPRPRSCRCPRTRGDAPSGTSTTHRWR